MRAKKKTKRKLRSAAKGALDLKAKIEKALRAEFPGDTVDISDGYKGNVHVLVVSRRFDNKNDLDRQAWLEDVIADSGISKAQRAKVSLVLAMSPGEIK